jgi:L-lactate dehydrogenase complex protein LldG
MNNTLDKDEILKSIRNGLQKAQFKAFKKKEINNKEIFFTQDKSLYEIFCEELIKISGECYYCHNNNELVDKLKGIHARENLGLCYSPDPYFVEIIKQSEVPYTERFENPDEIKSGISSCEFLVARFGSVMVSSTIPGGRRIFSFPEIHIVIANESQIVLELEEALEGILQKYGDDLPSQIINIAGPSRTADIEKTLVLGAHGPKKLFVFVLNND